MALPQIQIGDGMLGDALLSSVDVVQELNRHWWCTVVCRNTEDQRIPVEELLGKPVEVKTTDDDGVERVHFSGSVHDVQLDYEAFTAIGALVGHGGIVAFDDTVDMAKMARYAMEFCAVESCGKCTPCRIGSTRGVETIDKIRAGERVSDNIAVVEDLCNTMKFGSLCALGGFTPYPVMSALKHFREDFGPAPTRLQAAE